MARGTAFSELVTRLRNETGRTDDVNIGVDELPKLKQVINSNYQTLYLNHDWAHLKKVFTRITLTAGTRYYNLPTGLNSERIIRAVVWRDAIASDLVRGIDAEDYNVYDPEDDERSEPALKFDIKWTGSADQVEIWPLPSTNNQELQFTGIQAAPRLVNDADLCLLDDDLVVGFAAAELLGEKEGALKLKKAQEHLRILKARGKGAEQVHQMGLGIERTKNPPITIRIS